MLHRERNLKMITISLVNHKGGVGKSSIALAIAQGLDRTGLKTLFLDLDPQGNSSYALSAKEQGINAYQLLKQEPINLYNLENKDGMDYIPSNSILSVIEPKLELNALKDALEPLKDKYNYCIIDTPPALNLLTLNALNASDELLIPAKTDIFSFKGIEQLSETIQAVQDTSNNKLDILGIVFNMYDSRTVLSRLINANFENLASKLNTRILTSKIRNAEVVNQCLVAQQSIYDYAPTSKVATDYENLCLEILDLEKEIKF